MVVPLAVLAVCSVFVGLYFVVLSGSWGGNTLTDFLQGAPSLAAGTIAATKVPAEFHLWIAGVSTVVALAGILLAMYLYLGDAREANVLQHLFDLQGIDRLTDPQWVVGLERVPWIGATTRFLRSIHLGWLVTLTGYVLGAISLVLAIPLLIGQFISPYKLSKNKFYFDELYAALVVWPLRILASVCYWIDRWIVDGLVNCRGPGAARDRFADAFATDGPGAVLRPGHGAGGACFGRGTAALGCRVMDRGMTRMINQLLLLTIFLPLVGAVLLALMSQTRPANRRG